MQARQIITLINAIAYTSNKKEIARADVKMEGQKIFSLFLSSLVLVLIMTVFAKSIARTQNTIALDDFSPAIPCEDELFSRASLIFVMPFYNNTVLSEFPEWCSRMRMSGKDFALHGLKHTFYENMFAINETELSRSITEFEKCFGKKPEKYRPPMWKISAGNMRILKKHGLVVYDNPLTTNTYHCNNKGFIY
jgi:peptidoglycan/xylan/chitin deacetylase (PgdA/CDA1 family)